MKKRIGYYDVARGLGIIFVVIGHIDSFYMPFRHYVVSFHMALFFMISGMLLVETQAEDKSFGVTALKKFKSIMIPYFLYSLLAVFIEGVRLMLNGVFYWPHLESLLLTTITLQGISVMWFLPALFISELLFLGVRKSAVLVCNGNKKPGAYADGVGVKQSRMADFVTIVSIFLVIMLMVRCNAAEEQFYTRHLGMAGAKQFHEFVAMLIRGVFCSVFICMGYFIKKYIMGRKIASFRYGILSIVLLILCAVMLKLNPNVDLRSLYFGGEILNLFLYLTCAVSGGAGIVFLCKACEKYTGCLLFRILMFFGGNSLIIMATHLDFHVLHYSMELANVLNRYVPSPVLYHMCLLLTLFAAEALVIIVINRFFPILTGKFGNNKEIS